VRSARCLLAVGPTALAERSGNISLVAHYADGHWQQVALRGLGLVWRGTRQRLGGGSPTARGRSLWPLILHFDGSTWARC
jgi:hypothetical protein